MLSAGKRLRSPASKGDDKARPPTAVQRFTNFAEAALAGAQRCSTATLSDAMGRHGATSPEIRPIYENIRMVAPHSPCCVFPAITS
jgi:hypothetical protein